MQEIKKTIAIQVTDQGFLDKYEKRIGETGLKVRDYLMGLITADIENAELAKEPKPAQNDDISELIDDPALMAQVQERLDRSGMTLPEYLSGLVQDDMAKLAHTPEPDPEQNAADHNAAPVQGADNITNLFVKVTKEQREALEARKIETGENVGTLLNRLIGDFLGNVKSGNFPEGFDETYDYYASVAGTCNTTCSAKIPTETNQELFAYLEQTGKSRNVLMSCLVQMDFNSQEMSEDQGQGMTM